ncbi:hypothetical protein D915_000757 [Fasciola hepatica]|uniref:Uncharacterized protein n=1 Tax=Fasciola hepatica TaxID=6192 RepID=A0A4E0RNF8_FASHE|nr:hypothetical protein D915_000757 [Fasciola hepatica]
MNLDFTFLIVLLAINASYCAQQQHLFNVDCNRAMRKIVGVCYDWAAGSQRCKVPKNSAVDVVTKLCKKCGNCQRYAHKCLYKNYSLSPTNQCSAAQQMVRQLKRMYNW